MLGARLDSLPLTVHRDFANAQLQIDQTRLEQILVNLIGNAVDAMQAQPAPELWLEGSSSEGKYRLHVRDNGHGIDPEARKHLFEPFFTTSEHGTGLGLYIARQLCEANQASLKHVPLPAGGSCFRITLARTEPLARRS